MWALTTLMRGVTSPLRGEGGNQPSLYKTPFHLDPPVRSPILGNSRERKRNFKREKVEVKREILERDRGDCS